MIDLVTFTGGLSVMALQLNQPATAELLKAYHMGLEDETTPEEWRAFIRVAPKRYGWKFLPTVPQIADALAEFRGQPSLEVEASEAYQRVLESGTYTAEAGTVWSQRAVSDKCGRAAAEAFMAAGGPQAFASSWDESRRRERFFAAYRESARDRPADRLLPAGDEQKLLPVPAGHEAPEFTKSEAKGFLDKLRELVPEAVPQPAAAPVVVVATDERMAALKAQAARMLAEEQVEADAV